MIETDKIFRQAYDDHKNGKLNDAADGYQTVLSAEPSHPSALHLLGLIEYDREDIDAALPLIKKSIELVPNDLQWQLNYGDILSQTGDYKSAITAYRKSLAIDSESRVAKAALAELYYKSEKYDDSLMLYYKLLCDTQTDPEIGIKYAETLKAMGNTSEAMRFLSWFEPIMSSQKNRPEKEDPDKNKKTNHSPNILNPKKRPHFLHYDI